MSMPLFAPSQMLTVDVFIWNRFSQENYGDFNAEFQTHWVGIDVLEYILKKEEEEKSVQHIKSWDWASWSCSRGRFKHKDQAEMEEVVEKTLLSRRVRHTGGVEVC